MDRLCLDEESAGADRPEEVGRVRYSHRSGKALGDGPVGPSGGCGGLDQSAVDPPVDDSVGLLMARRDLQGYHHPVGGDLQELQPDLSVEALIEILLELGWLLVCDRAQR